MCNSLGPKQTGHPFLLPYDCSEASRGQWNCTLHDTPLPQSYTYIHAYTYIHTHTHTHIYIYIYIWVHMYLFLSFSNGAFYSSSGSIIWMEVRCGYQRWNGESLPFSFYWNNGRHRTLSSFLRLPTLSRVFFSCITPLFPSTPDSLFLCIQRSLFQLVTLI